MKTIHGLILLVILALLGVLRILRPVEGFVATPAPSLADAKFTATALERACKALPDVMLFIDKFKANLDRVIKFDTPGNRKDFIILHQKASSGVIEWREVCATAGKAKLYIDRLTPSVPKTAMGNQNLQAPNNLNMGGNDSGSVL